MTPAPGTQKVVCREITGDGHIATLPFPPGTPLPPTIAVHEDGRYYALRSGVNVAGETIPVYEQYIPRGKGPEHLGEPG
jgi:hypothetical protein